MDKGDKKLNLQLDFVKMRQEIMKLEETVYDPGHLHINVDKDSEDELPFMKILKMSLYKKEQEQELERNAIEAKQGELKKKLDQNAI